MRSKSFPVDRVGLCGIVLLAAVFLPWPALAEATPPALGSVELAQPLPKPYDETIDAGRQIDDALLRAQGNGKRVLVELGGNWCPDCRVLGAVLALPAVSAFVRSHFETVSVNIGRFDRNMDIPARFGIAKLTAVPSVLVIAPDGTLLNPGEIIALGDARTMAPQDIVNWLAHWAPTPPKAG